jgi:hypothetical protein
MLAAHLDPFAATAEGEAMLAQSRVGDWLARVQGRASMMATESLRTAR